jgi:lipoprotein-anchoring transpeptidase ErfK/SrfK
MHPGYSWLAAAGTALALLGAPVMASPAAAGQGGLGGGFIEMLFTAQNPSPQTRAETRRQIRAAPPATRAYWGNAGFHMSEEPEEAVPQFIERAPAARPAERQASLGTYPVERGLDPVYRRQEVAYDGKQAPGTIVIDTPHKFLYLVQGNGRALRYGVGVGRPGFKWAGVKSVTRKAEWPGWTPPTEMLKRRPDLPRHMVGGPANPLGARAMYLGSSLYRIHGTNEPHTIGTNVSSGCIRLLNADVIDLYSRVKVGTKVVVM